jgi:hypothetical protein
MAHSVRKRTSTKPIHNIQTTFSSPLVKGKHDAQGRSLIVRGLAILTTLAINRFVSRRIFLFLLNLPALIFTSCVEGEEELWINQNGSGRILAHYELPRIALSRLGNPDDTMRAFINIDEREEDLKIQALSFGEVNGKIVFHLEATFENALDLLEIIARNKEAFIEESGNDPVHLDAIAGVIHFNFEDCTPKFSRAVSLGGLFPTAVNRRPGMLGPSTFKYTIHLPAKVIESNAHSISEDGKTVSWNFLLKEHFAAPMEMGVTIKIPIPWWAWAVLAMLTFALALLIWKFVIRRFI